MGVDEGFDLWPPLTESDEDKELWEFFLIHVKRKYKNDSVMTIDKRGDVVFEVGEHPRLIKDAHRFRRFSAKVSGSHCGNVHVYLRQVEDIAKECIGTIYMRRSRLMDGTRFMRPGVGDWDRGL